MLLVPDKTFNGKASREGKQIMYEPAGDKEAFAMARIPNDRLIEIVKKLYEYLANYQNDDGEPICKTSIEQGEVAAESNYSVARAFHLSKMVVFHNGTNLVNVCMEVNIHAQEVPNIPEEIEV